VFGKISRHIREGKSVFKNVSEKLKKNRAGFVEYEFDNCVIYKTKKDNETIVIYPGIFTSLVRVGEKSYLFWPWKSLKICSLIDTKSSIIKC
jgi:hypothetical protein